MKTYLYRLSGLLILFSFHFVAAQQAVVAGTDLFTDRQIQVSGDAKKGVVVVFLSAVCPCSNSHIKELKALQKDFAEFSFVGVHSNSDEDKTSSVRYFKNANLPFPVVQDVDGKLIDRFKALKTPHAFVLKPDGEIVYQGGVSSSRDFDKAEQKFLREALEDVRAEKTVRTPRGRTLGCAISRGQNVW